MKRIYCIVAIVIGLLVEVKAQPPGCGNNCLALLTGCKNCPESGTATFDAYTGNLHREIHDLEIWGGAGDTQLIWKRYYNSRNGWEPWTHAFDYRMTYEGVNENGRDQILATFPEGGGALFTQDVTDPNQWIPLPGIDARIFQSGNNYFLQRGNGYRFRFEKINSFIYGVKYQLQDFRDPYQNLYTLTYDSWHNLLRVTEPAGRFFAIEYVAIYGKLVIGKVKTNDGRAVVYNYSLHNDGILDWLLLSSVNYGDGTVATYKYAQSQPGRLMLLQHALDPRFSGKSPNMRYVYDINVAEGFIKEERNGITNEVTATLETKQGSRWICYPNGRVQHFIMPENMRGKTAEYIDGLGRSTKWEYENGGIGFIKAETDGLGRTTFYKKSIYGNNLEIFHPDGTKESWTRDDLDLVLTYTNERGYTIKYTRDNLHRVTKITYPDGTNELFTYNNLGQVLTHTFKNGGVETNVYDNRGLRVKSINALNNITHYSYDGSDRLASVTDALGHITKHEYNERGLPVKLINADNSFKLYGYDSFGNRILETNELGNSWRKIYDEFKRVVSEIDPLNRETKFSYDIVGGGCGCLHAQGKPTRIILPSGKTTIIEYDVEWQKIKEIIAPGSSEASVTVYEYDAKGNFTAVIDPRGKLWTYTYSERSRITSATDPLLQTTTFSYDAEGNMIEIKRPDNSKYKYQYDNMGRRTHEINPKGEITKMVYDAEDNMIELIDPGNRVYLFGYDLLNRHLKTVYPSGGEHFSYDAVDNLKTYTTPTGQVRSFIYDSRNREVSSVWSDDTPPVNRSYDAASRVISQSNNISQLTYTYNDANELTSETQKITGEVPRQMTYSYNADGLRSSFVYPAGSMILNYDYTARNQLGSINLNGEYLTSYGYDVNGNKIAQFRKNAVGTANTYDNANQLLSITHQKGGIAFAHFDYGYNNIGHRTFVRRNYGKGDVYTYDITDQLTAVQYEAENPQNEPAGATRIVNYTYDASGNRQNVSDNGSSTNYISNLLNQYTKVGGSDLTYNNNGDLQSFNGWSYKYDAQSRLIRAEKSGMLIDFIYDPRNRCVRRTVNGVHTYLYYDEWNLVEEVNATNSLIAQYVHGLNTDELIVKASPANMIFYHQDVLGNVTQLTDASGSVVEQYSYDVFGTPKIMNGSGIDIGFSAVNNRFLYTGREFIPEIGLYDYRNRMYSTVLGRFLQMDPIRFAASDFNLYRYVYNNPVNNTDPDGLECCTWWQKIQCAFQGLVGGIKAGVKAAVSSAVDQATSLSNIIAAKTDPKGTAAKVGFKSAVAGVKEGIKQGKKIYADCCAQFPPCKCKKK